MILVALHDQDYSDQQCFENHIEDLKKAKVMKANVFTKVYHASKSINTNSALVAMYLNFLASLVSQAIMIMLICSLVWYINIFRQRCGCYQPKSHLLDDDQPQVSKTAAALQDRHIQLVLVLSGLREAVSLALVESVPIYNTVTNTGTKYKGVMKAMTSGSIIFTIFVLGGSSYYILRNLDIRSVDEKLNKQLHLTKMQDKSCCSNSSNKH